MADINIPAAEAEGQPPEPPKVTFDDAQKARINEIVAEASRRAGSEARAEAARLTVELEAARKAQVPAAEDTDARVKLAEAEAELGSLRAAQQEATVRDALLKAAGNTFLDSDLAVRIMKDSTRLIDGKLCVVGADGAVRLNSNFEPMSAAELATELAGQKPFLARGEVRGGAGSTPTKGDTSNAVDLTIIFGKTASCQAANALAMRDPQRQLREQARQRGLL